MRKSKYRNVKINALGKKFDSKGEYNRYLFLLDQEKRGVIFGLECQVPFKIKVNEYHICKYIADFTYYIDNDYTVEDYKGVETAVFKLKKKLMLAANGIDIKVTKSPTEKIK